MNAIGFEQDRSDTQVAAEDPLNPHRERYVFRISPGFYIMLLRPCRVP